MPDEPSPRGPGCRTATFGQEPLALDRGALKTARDCIPLHLPDGLFSTAAHRSQLRAGQGAIMTSISCVCVQHSDVSRLICVGYPPPRTAPASFRCFTVCRHDRRRSAGTPNLRQPHRRPPKVSEIDNPFAYPRPPAPRDHRRAHHSAAPSIWSAGQGCRRPSGL